MESAPRAYRLKASNAAPPISTFAGAIPARDAEVLRSGHQLIIDEHPLHTPRNGTRLITSRRLAFMGANSYIVKPVDFEQFTESVRDIGKYWLEINHTPSKQNLPKADVPLNVSAL